MTVQRFSHKAFGGRQITVLAEEELDRIAQAVDGAVEIRPATTNLHIGFVDMSFAGHATLAPVKTFEQQRRELHDPAMDCGMVDVNAALGHHLLQISKAEIVSQIPAYAQQDHRTVKMTA